MKKANLQVLLVSSNYPDKFHLWAPWNKKANISISKIKGIKTEIIAPRPYSLPFKFLPHSEISKIPKVENFEEGLVHYPRFLYLLPKKLFYGISGSFFRYSIPKYIFKNTEKPDIIHSHHTYIDGYGIIPVCKKLNIPLVVDIHGDALFSDNLDKGIVGKRIFKTLCFANKIICVSKNIYLLAKKSNLPEKKLEYIPLGVDIDNFKPRPKGKIRTEFGISEKNVVLFVGQITEEKGIKYLLESIAQLSKKDLKDTKFVIIGYGPKKQEYEELSKSFRISKYVKFTGPVYGEKLLKWYSLADIFVLPSFFEGKPTVVNEAMASECAIIASKVSGIPEQVKDGYNGFLIKPKNSKILTEKISYLLNNKDETAKMGKNSRKKIIDEGWTWENYAKKVTDLYKKLV